MTNAKVKTNMTRPYLATRVSTMSAPREGACAAWLADASAPPRGDAGARASRLANAVIPMSENTTVASMNGAPNTAPTPTAVLEGSRSTSSAITATIVSGKLDPTAATTAPTALLV